MDWKSAVSEVAKYAPAVATAIGSPAAGAMASGAADFVTGLLGIENTPEALVAATQDPEKRTELIRIDREHKQELEKIRANAEVAQAQETTKRLSETNQTMRAELESDSTLKAGWRGGLGWIFDLSCLGVMASIVFAMFQPGTNKAELINSALVIFGIMATVLGIDISRVGRERMASMGRAPTSFMDAVKTRVAGK
ncbi:3TM-type holin [Chromohalobacter sp. HP20-39]|uniref:3TM-type holin n=1 Tax=Chromohalobacter sp. HP20-39 TaxID=3079306 RepID=UPI00294AE966|nr:3TM-type holin [Chromohalobacter sp. HP20-39]MDV6318792.1 3TM-type holin [Chromohalobacter sp. HP20-39]